MKLFLLGMIVAIALIFGGAYEFATHTGKCFGASSAEGSGATPMISRSNFDTPRHGT